MNLKKASRLSAEPNQVKIVKLFPRRQEQKPVVTKSSQKILKRPLVSSKVKPITLHIAKGNKFFTSNKQSKMTNFKKKLNTRQI